MANTKTYLVEYKITAQDAASDVFSKIARSAEKSVKPLNTMAKGISEFNSTIQSIGSSDAFKGLMNLTPKFSKNEWETALNGLVKIAKDKSVELKDSFTKPLKGLIPQEGSKAFNDLQKKYDDLVKKNEELSKSFESLKAAAMKPVTSAAGKSSVVEAVKAENNDLDKLFEERSELFKKRDDVQKKYNEANAKFDKAKHAFNNREPYALPWDKVIKMPEGSADREAPTFKKALEARDAFKQVWSEKEAIDKQVQELNDKIKAANDAAKKVKGKAVETTKEVSNAATVGANTLIEDLTKKGSILDNLLATTEKLKENFKFTTSIDTAPAIAKINDLLHLVRDNAVTIPITFGGTGVNPKKAIDETTGKITEEGRKAADEANSIINQGKNRTKKAVKSSEPTLVQRINDQLAAIQKLAPTLYVDIVPKQEGLQEKVNAIIKAIKPEPIKVDVLPIDGTKSGEGTKGVSKKGAKSGDTLSKITKNISAQYAKLQKYADEQPIIVRSIFNGSQAQFDLSILLHNLQKYANDIPVIARSVFNGSEAKFNLSVTLHELQKYAESSPVVIATKLKKPKTDISKILPKQKKYDIPVNVKLKATGLSQASLNKLIPKNKKVNIPVNIKLTGASSADIKKALPKSNKLDVPINVKFNSANVMKSFNTLIKNAKSKATVDVKLKLDTNGIAKKINDAVKKAKTDVTLKLTSKGVSSDLKKVLTTLQDIADKKPIQIKTELNSGKAIESLTTTIEKLQRAVNNLNKNSALQTQRRMSKMDEAAANVGRAEATPVQRRVEAFVGGGNSGGRVYGAGANADLYTRLRAWAYPLTGNTSFGASTPAAISMMKDMGSMMAVFSFMGAIGSGLHQAIDYQNTMKTVQAILQTSDNAYNLASFNNMQRTVRNVGKETKFIAPQVAGAARFMAMAGLSTKDINNAIRPVADVALIGDTDLATTADKLTNVMTTFGLKSPQMRTIADVMTSTFTRTNTDMMMLAESAKYAGGIAHLYGGKDFMKTFSDTMAMFGILGNAGIQASSAGTTIRMMYQNLMQPNKNQREMLEKYHIFTRDKNGQPYSMVDILKEIHSKVPDNQLADFIGTAFRITAQPGAAAIARSLGDKGSANLLNIIDANRKAMGSGVSGHIANEKKMTLSGLMYQVQSAFGEGILQAVEGRQKQWADILKRLTKFLSNPEIIDALSKIVDLVEYLAKTMLGFVRIWVKGYTMFPNLINNLLKFQMIMTQIGYLFNPFVQMVGTLRTFLTMIPGVKGLGGGAGKFASSTVAGVAGSGIVALTSLPYGQTDNNALPMLIAEEKGQRFGRRQIFHAVNSPAYAAERNTLLRIKHTQQAMATRRLAQAAEMEGNIVAKYGYLGLNFATLSATTRSMIKSGKAIPMYENIARDLEKYDQLKANAAINQKMADRAKDVLQKRTAAVRRPLQLANEALMDRYYHVYPMKDFKARMGESLNAGRKFMSVGIESILINGWKATQRVFVSIAAGFVKAIGAITSPMGLATTAIIGLVGATVYAVHKWNEAKKEEQHAQKITAKYSHNVAKQLNKQNDRILKNGIHTNITLQSGISSLPKVKVPSLSRRKKNRKIRLENSEITNTILNYAKYNPEAIANISDINKYQKYIPESVKTDLLGGALINKRIYNSISKKNAQSAAIIGQWANQAIIDSALSKDINSLEDALSNGNVKQGVELLNKYKPTSGMRMSELGDARKIAGITNPTQYYEWQYAQWKRMREIYNLYSNIGYHRHNVLTELDNYKKFEKKEAKLPSSERTEYNAGYLLRELVQSIPQVINGTQASISLNKMGQIDWNALANTVNHGIPFSFGQQQQILQNTYAAIYNDPNIQNVSSIIGLLNKYLPAIANTRFEFPDWNLNDSSWSFTGTHPTKPGKSKAIKVPFKPKKGNALDNLPHLTIGGVQFHLGSSEFDANIKKYKDIVKGTIASYQHKQEQEKSLRPRIVHPNVGSANAPSYGRKGGGSGVISSGGYGTSGVGKKKKSGRGSGQKDYASTYNRDAARPTQVNITIENLCRFDRTMIAKNADEKTMIETIENKLGEAISMLAASALNSAGQVIQSGLN